MSYQGPYQQSQYQGSEHYGAPLPQQPAGPYAGPPRGGAGYYPPPGFQPQGGNLYGTTPGPAATSMGMAQHKAAGLSYLFKWITGIIFLLREKQNHFVRFHAMQSLIFFGGLNLLFIVLQVIIFLGIPYISFAAILLCILVFLISTVTWIILMVNGFRGNYFKLPIVGDYAQKYANQNDLF